MSSDRPDFGARLRAAREARGLSLKDVADATKISLLVLGALERNDISRLPGGIFSRAMVRAYAKEVGLDPERTVRDFAETFSNEEESASLDEIARGPRSTGDLDAPSPASALRWLALTVTLLLVVVWVGITRYQGNDDKAAGSPPAAQRVVPRAPAPPVLPKPDMAVPPPPAPADVTPGAESGRQPASVTPQPTEPGAGGADRMVQPSVPEPSHAPGAPVPTPPGAVTAPPGPPPVPFDPNLPLRIVLSPRSPCWLSVTVDGNRLVGRTLQAGEKVQLSAAKSVVLTAGDAAALSYTVNNAPGRPLGASGQVVRVVITPTNYSTFIEGRQ